MLLDGNCVVEIYIHQLLCDLKGIGKKHSLPKIILPPASCLDDDQLSLLLDALEHLLNQFSGVVTTPGKLTKLARYEIIKKFLHCASAKHPDASGIEFLQGHG